jgi:branched-chain amino acid transport system substrate-binding protein
MRPTGQLTYFRLAATDDLQGKAAADYFLKILHHHTVLLLKDDSDRYSLGLAQAFGKEWIQLGGQVIPGDLETYNPGVDSDENILRSFAGTRPDLIYLAGDASTGKDVLQALASIPALKNIDFAGDDGIMDSSFLQAASQLNPSASVYASLPIADPNHASTSIGLDFRANYTASGYSDYSPSAAAAYDCTMILIRAIKAALQAGLPLPSSAHDQRGVMSFRQEVLRELRQTSYDGATGQQGFDDNGDTTNPTISFYQLNLSQPQPNWQWLQQSSV